MSLDPNTGEDTLSQQPEFLEQQQLRGAFKTSNFKKELLFFSYFSNVLGHWP